MTLHRIALKLASSQREVKDMGLHVNCWRDKVKSSNGLSTDLFMIFFHFSSATKCPFYLHL